MQEEKPKEGSSSSDSDLDIPVTVDDVYSEYEGLTGITPSSGAQRSYQSPTLFSVASNSLTRLTSSISSSRGHMSS